MAPILPTINTTMDSLSRWPNPPPPSPSSPLSQPPLLPDSPSDTSPLSQHVLTPNSPAGSYFGDLSPRPETLKSDHSMLHSMAAMPTPTLPSEGFSTPVTPPSSISPPRHAFPLLPPHHPLRHKMHLDIGRISPPSASSPPTTPKGHPLDSAAVRFPKGKTHPISNPYAKTTAALAMSSIRVPRRHRPVLLFCLCAFVFGLVWVNNSIANSRQLATFSQQQASALSRRQEQSLIEREANRHVYVAQRVEEAMHYSVVSGASSIEFETPHEELAALIGFVTSTTSNALSDVDPSTPLDPSIVLDFDPSRPGAREDLDLLVSQIYSLYPLVLMGKMRDPWHREIKSLLAEYKITPSPLIIDVDQRRDADTFIPLLARILGSEELPQLILDGKAMGSYQEILDLKANGEFAPALIKSGLSVRDAKKKKKGVKERQRLENERVLGPAPIRDV